MKLNGNNIYMKGSVLPVALEIEGLSPEIDISQPQADLRVTFYTVDACTGTRMGSKSLTLSLANDDDKFRSTEEYNVFAAMVDTAALDVGRLAGEVSFDVDDELTALPLKPIVPFLTDYFIKSW